MTSRNVGTEIGLLYDTATDSLGYQDQAGIRRALKGTTDAVPREVKVFTAVLSPAIVATITVAESAAQTVTGLLTTDTLLSIIKPTAQAGLGIAGGRIAAANDLRIWFVNPTAGGITPTASETYTVTVLR
jgi:hypothetical protein